MEKNDAIPSLLLFPSPEPNSFSARKCLHLGRWLHLMGNTCEQTAKFLPHTPFSYHSQSGTGFLQPPLITTTLCLPLQPDISHYIKSAIEFNSAYLYSAFYIVFRCFTEAEAGEHCVIHSSLKAVSLLHTLCRNKRCPVDLKAKETPLQGLSFTVKQ